jgi:hypothetical protein
MKRSIFYSICILIILTVLSNNSLLAQSKQANAKKFLNRTNQILAHAREVVRQNKVYTGNLSKASNHQKYAKELFKEGKFKTAMYHSNRARSLAFDAMKANKTNPKSEMQLTTAEQDLIKDIPIAAQLDAELIVQENTTDEQAAAEKDVDLK